MVISLTPRVAPPPIADALTLMTTPLNLLTSYLPSASVWCWMPSSRAISTRLASVLMTTWPLRARNTDAGLPGR
jgi:hypothetical protein